MVKVMHNDKLVYKVAFECFGGYLRKEKEGLRRDFSIYFSQRIGTCPWEVEGEKGLN